MSARELSEDLQLTARTERYADTMRLIQSLQRESDTLGTAVDELGDLTYSHVLLNPSGDVHDNQTVFTKS